MNKLRKLLVILGILLGSTQLAIGIPVEPNLTKTKISSTSEQMLQLLSNWNFEVTNCQEDVAKIKHDVTGEVVCVVPNETIGIGQFIYNSNNKQLQPANIQAINQGSDVPQASDNQVSINSVAKTEDSRIEQVVFDFNNSYDYGACLDTILLAYENREVELDKADRNDCANHIFSIFGKNLSKDITLQLIQLADTYATTELATKLYPSLGIRRRVAINLGYVYDIDQENREILQHVTSNE
ncbi:MAG TPA: hypothetical protein ACFCUY_16160 [Xenococcaceae cyanobacterium]